MTLINTVSHDMSPLVRKVSRDFDRESTVNPIEIVKIRNEYLSIAGISGSSSVDGAAFRKLFRNVSFGRGAQSEGPCCRNSVSV